jgi:hypothetical protein
MSKKMKISEAQLKRLVENNMETSHMSLDETGVGSVELSVAKEVAPLVMSKLSEMSVNPNDLDMGILSRALQHELSQQGASSNDDNTDMMEPETDEMSMSGGDDMSSQMSDENLPALEGPLNESIMEYKKQFERYMKSPKK